MRRACPLAARALAMRVVLGAAASVGVAAATLGCGGPARPPAREMPAAEPAWQDVFDRAPDLLAVLRPKLLREDKVYGPLLRRALGEAREHSRVVAAARTLDAMQDCDEVIVGVNEASREHGPELVLVLRGVRADIDPEQVVDADGCPLWSPGPGGAVRELTREPRPRGDGGDGREGSRCGEEGAREANVNAHGTVTADAAARDAAGSIADASLFELPGRTWVVATGAARARARSAFAHPWHRPLLSLDASALAAVRVQGAALVAHVEPLQPRGGLAAVGTALRSLTLLLPPGGQGALDARFAYGTEDASALAEVTLRRLLDALMRKRAQTFGWLSAATIERRASRIDVKAPLPPPLVDALLHAGPVRGSLSKIPP